MSAGNDYTDGPDAVQRRVETAGAALHSTIDKVANPARNAVDGMSSAAHETVDKLASSANHTAERFSEQTRRISEAPVRAVEASRSWIQDRPFEAMGAALAFGFIVGRLTGR
jgi:ElaB/YqjD/DUF883 family membrane-anchored ribosome-binding protein